MSFYDDASIVMIPSGYKAGKLYCAKPTDGSGDLSFTRTGSTATRVNESGLIERCRTNQILRSEEFNNASWTKVNSTVSADSTTSPINTITADSLNDNATTNEHYVVQSFTYSAVSNTYSVYAKANSLSYIVLKAYDGTSFFTSGTFNLSNGTVSGSGIITNAGNGWYRCSFSFNSASGSGFAYVFTSNGTSTTYLGSVQSVFLWGAQLETGDIATAYIPTTTAAVTVGPIANVPRLDYTGGGCPKLLMEPTRTNIATYSQQLDNAAWSRQSVSVTANNIVSPDSYLNAELITADGTNNIHDIFRTFTGATTLSASIFIKRGSQRYFYISLNYESTGTNWGNCIFDLQNLTTTTYNDGNVTSPIGSIVSYGNDWYRCSLSVNCAAAVTMYSFFGFSNNVQPASGSRGRIAYASSSTAYFYGAQIEAGSYATSYIPTFNASVTRNADSASKTGISSLIGQTEGTVFSEVEVINGLENLAIWMRQSGTLYSNMIFVGFSSSRQSRTEINVGGVNFVNITGPIVSAGYHKIALAYRVNDFVLYVDGVQVGIDTSGSVPTCNEIYIDQYIDGGVRNATKKQLLVFKTRLSNSELATLTTL